MSEETIVALATPPGQSGVAVVRMSGPGTLGLLSRVVDRPPRLWRARHLYHKTLLSGDEVIDRGLVAFFPAPASFTGEDVAEFQVHGNPFLVQTLLAALTQHEGVRMAKAGEFSHRAYLNGKMDLPRAEALNLLIQAHSDTAYRLSLNALDGAVTRLADELRSALIELSALFETEIEFAEEQHLGEVPLIEPLDRAREKVDVLLRRAAFYDRHSRGLRMVIAGPTNAGKSSLFNALLGEDRALVSEQPGTTRDLLKERFYLHHVAVELIDTAGINPDSRDRLEQAGIERGLKALSDASALIFVHDASQELASWEIDFISRFESGPKALLLNKVDLLPGAAPNMKGAFASDVVVLPLSVKRTEGLSRVRELLESWSLRFMPSADDVAVTMRQRELLNRIAQGLDKLTGGVKAGELVELLAEEIRTLLDQLGALTGRVTPDEILEQVFSTFCIGK